MTVCLWELKRLIMLPFNITSIKSFPNLLIDIKPIPRTVTPSLPNLLFSILQSITASLSFIAALSKGILSFSHKNSFKRGV